MDILKLAAENSPRSKMVYHEDTQALHIGTLEKHCYFVPFAKGQDPFEGRENSQRMELLNGNWGFRYYDSIIDLEDDFIHEKLYSPKTVALMLILYGFLFIIVENQKKSHPVNKLSKLDYKTAFLIGIFQVLALVPGTSRSGATIIGASILGASRSVAAEYSFFLAIPVMFGASGFKFLKYILKVGLNFSITELLILVFGMVSAFFVSVWAIKFLMNYIKKHDFKAFGYYRIILGIIVLLYFAVFNF